MSTAAYLAPPPRPPHDPLRTRLSAIDGWRPAPAPFNDAVTVSGGEGSLRLALLEPAAPTLLDPSGTLGGLVPPPHVSLAPDGTLYLLDRHGQRLLWFDPCACRFVPLPCLAPPGPADPRRLANPVALAAGPTSLWLADGSDGGSVVRLARRDLAVLEVLRRDWPPGPLAVDGCERLYVADLGHGVVQRFSPSGRRLGEISGHGLILGLATDLEDRLYVVSADKLRRFTADGAPLDEPSERHASPSPGLGEQQRFRAMRGDG